MATRRVSVFLELLTAGYTKDATQAAAVTRKVSVEMEKLGDETDEVSRDMDQLAANTAVAKRQVDDLGDEARGAATDLTLLDARVRSLDDSMRRLRAPSLRGGGGVGWMGSGLDFSQGLSEARGMGIAALVVLAAEAAPLIGSMIAGAVIGGVGFGGVIGGTVAASKDPRVKEAYSDLFGQMGRDIKDDAAVFVDPLISAADIFGDEWVDISAKLETAFRTLAPGIEPLARGIAGLASELADGFNVAAAAAVPIMEDMERELPELGREMETFLRIMSDPGVDARGGFQDLMDLIQGAVRTTGAVVGGLAATWKQFKDTPDWMKFGALAVPAVSLPVGGAFAIGSMFGVADHAVAGVVGGLFELNPALQETSFLLSSRVAPGADEAARSLEDIIAATEQLLDVTERLIPAAFDMEETQDQAANTAARLTEQLEAQHAAGVDGAGSLDRNTQAGRDNAEMVRDLVVLYGQMIANTAQAGGNTDVLKQQLRDQLLQMGFNAAAVDYYVGQLDRIPAEQITKLTIENQEALAAIQETDRELNRMMRDRNASVTIATYREGERASSYVPPAPISPASAQAGEGRRASGGDVFAGVPYVINERGYETVTFSGNGTVHPANLTPAWGSGPMVVENHIEVGGEVVRVVRTEISANDRNTKRRVQAGIPA